MKKLMLLAALFALVAIAGCKEDGEKLVEMKEEAEEIQLLEPAIYHVKDFGAVPDDGQDDADAIRRAIAAASREHEAVVVFDAGVYNLRNAAGQQAMIDIRSVQNLTLSGQKDAEGDPSTIFEMNLELGNDIVAGRHIDVNYSRNIRLENLILDHYPRFNTAGEIVEVDRERDRVVVDIFEDLPHFDGMRSYSANSWDLDTRDLLPVDALTIGVNIERFPHLWHHVPGGEGRRYAIEGMAFSDRVEPGQGISWHFNVIPPAGTQAPNNMRIFNNEDIVLENLFVHSAIGSSINVGDNKNVTFRRVHLKPEGNALAVGPRDGIHMPRNTGRLVMEDLYIKGVRWDPIVSYMNFIEVSEVTGDSGIRFALRTSAAAMKSGGQVVFWVGDKAVEREIASLSMAVGGYAMTFTEPLPAEVQAGSRFTPKAWSWEEAVIRNSHFEGNFGTPIIYENDNLLIENNVFRNNAYSSIELGPTSSSAAGFARNVVIKNNQFIQSTWATKSSGAVANGLNYGTITTFNKNPGFSMEPYNENIQIIENLFQDLHMGDHVSAIHLKNAQNVELRGNQYNNVNRRLLVEPDSTRDIRNEDGVELNQ